MSRYILLDTQDDGDFGTYIQGPRKDGLLLVDGYLKLIVTSDSLNTIASLITQADREAAHHQRLSGREYTERMQREEEEDGPCIHDHGAC